MKLHDDSPASSPPSQSHTCDKAACAFNWLGGEGEAAKEHIQLTLDSKVGSG